MNDLQEILIKISEDNESMQEMGCIDNIFDNILNGNIDNLPLKEQVIISLSLLIFEEENCNKELLSGILFGAGLSPIVEKAINSYYKSKLNILEEIPEDK